LSPTINQTVPSPPLNSCAALLIIILVSLYCLCLCGTRQDKVGLEKWAKLCPIPYKFLLQVDTEMPGLCWTLPRIEVGKAA